MRACARRHILARVRARDEAGKTAAEYVGALLVVAVIAGVLLTAGLGDTVAQAAQRAVACIARGSCPPGGDAAGPAGPAEAARPARRTAPACLLSSHEVTYTSTADFLFDRSVDGSTYLHAKHSDGVTEIRSTEFQGDGNVVLLGGELPIGAASCA
jgi:hypothetical protein